MSSCPWSFEQARQAARIATTSQRATEGELRRAAAGAAEAERAYRCALATKIVELRAAGEAATVSADLARGDKAVADLRYRRDVAEGVREATSQAAWRAAADRKDTASFIAWSMRATLRDDDPVGPDHPVTFGARVAA